MSNWILHIIINILRLFLVIGLGCFLGAIFEYRNWLKTASWLSGPLIKLGRFPEICGSAFLTAFVSNPAANSMIAGAHTDGKISRREMILSGIANSYPAKVSHSMRIMFPVVSALGLPGLLYFVLQFTGGFFRTIIILLIGRTKNSMPEFLVPYLPPEIMTVMISRLGGLLSAASVAYELQQQGQISSYQIIMAFFMGNVITNPIRTVRRNLPSAVGIFGKDGLIIVLILQGCRLIFALAVIFVLIYFFK